MSEQEIRAPFDREGFATVSETADYLGLSISSVYAMVRKGDLPHGKFAGNSIRIPRAAVVTYATERMQATE
jgi:excisionase family DNA binding protein